MKTLISTGKHHRDYESPCGIFCWQGVKRFIGRTPAKIRIDVTNTPHKGFKQVKVARGSGYPTIAIYSIDNGKTWELIETRMVKYFVSGWVGENIVRYVRIRPVD